MTLRDNTSTPIGYVIVFSRFIELMRKKLGFVFTKIFDFPIINYFLSFLRIFRLMIMSHDFIGLPKQMPLFTKKSKNL